MTLQTMSGASNIQYPTDPSTGAALKPIVYAGIAGTCPAGTICDTCQLDGPSGMTLYPCNHASVSLTAKLHLEMTTDTGTVYSSSDIRAAGTTQISGVTGTYDPGNKRLSVDIAWQDICVGIGLDSSCTGASGAQTLAIGLGSPSGGGVGVAEKFEIQVVVSAIDQTDSSILYTENCGPDAVLSSNTPYGYCYFEAERGDAKVYLDPLIPAESYPTYKSGVNYGGIEVFYASGAQGDEAAILNSITSKSPSKSLDLVSGQVALSENRVDGLTNDTQYCFVVANRDVTGNIFYFSPPPGTSPPGTLGPQTAQQMCAMPSEVAGLLDDKHCFIATAAFGSDMAPQVKVFRSFRNEFLLGSSWGRDFVRTYYKLSPPLANFISEHPVLKITARAALWPLLVFAKLSLQWGVIWTALLFGGVVFIVAEGFRRLLPQRSRKIL